jgi:hypothetical protein
MQPREDDTSATPPHGDTLGDRAPHGSPASRHGVQLDPRGEPDAAADAPREGVPSTPRTGARPEDTP